MEPEKRRNRKDVSESSPSPSTARQISPGARQQVVRAAFLKPLNLTMLFVGGGFFVVTQAWWVMPFALVTYALLVLLASRDQIFISKVLGEEKPLKAPKDATSLPPERRARWLPRGETRRTVEETLVTYRKLVASIEDSGEVARPVLDDTIPRLHAAAERLVEVAQEREKASEAVQEIRSYENDALEKERTPIIQDLENKIKTADEEISGTKDRLLTLRAQMVGASLNSDAENRAAAFEINRSLEELNYRLEALGELSSTNTGAPDDNERLVADWDNTEDDADEANSESTGEG